MGKCFDSLLRKVVPILSAGMLLQTGGCTFDAGSAAQTLGDFVLARIVSSIVFGAFNVSGGF